MSESIISRDSSSSLKRSLSLPLITFYGLGTILGTGIYVLIGKIAGIAGIYAPFAFLLAAVVAFFTAFSYAELSSRYPSSAGAALYVEKAFSKRWLSTALGWSVVLTGIVSAGTMVNGFVGYLTIFIKSPLWLSITVLVIGLGLLAAWGINESVGTAAVITLVEVFGLILVLFMAGDSLSELPQRWQELVPPLSGSVWLNVTLGAFLAFYAFIGFEDMVNVAEEVKNPSRNLPLSILLALSIATLLYMLVALVSVLALPLDLLAQSDAPLASIIEHKGVHSPIIILILVLALWLPLVTLAKATSFIILVVFALVNLSLCYLKLGREPHPDGAVNYPLWIPILGFLLCLGILILQVFSSLGK